MRKLLVLVSLCFCAFTNKSDVANASGNDPKKFAALLPNTASAEAINNLVDSVYTRLHLQEAGLSREAFFAAYKGYEYLLAQNMLRKTDLLTIADYSQPSSNKRLYVLDLAKNKILFNTYVAHGKNSGEEYCTSFSNSNSSNKSSAGFLITAETYNGGKGYSMRFDGVERGINDNVRARSIVMHGSAYVNAERAKNGTMMGRSWGCPAVSFAEHKAIINTIKGGSCFFIYNPSPIYTKRSEILNADFAWPALSMPQAPVMEAPIAVSAK